MATIELSKSHTLPIDDAKKKAEDLARGMAEKLGLEWKWAGDAIDFHAASGMAKGVKGQVAVSEKEVKVSVDLPMMLRMMKGTIEDKIKEKLNAIG
ncbi:MAG: polyhydroxyalkanoic acid system family protein [Polyangiaceae bacterium]|nr:polyhydroxyalkanoic acid system family protein [Polyangiaceae bacterium]